MNIVRDYIKCVVIEGGAYERGEFAGNMWCRVNENGEFECSLISPFVDILLFVISYFTPQPGMLCILLNNAQSNCPF